MSIFKLAFIITTFFLGVTEFDASEAATLWDDLSHQQTQSTSPHKLPAKRVSSTSAKIMKTKEAAPLLNKPSVSVSGLNILIIINCLIGIALLYKIYRRRNIRQRQQKTIDTANRLTASVPTAAYVQPIYGPNQIAAMLKIPLTKQQKQPCKDLTDFELAIAVTRLREKITKLETLLADNRLTAEPERYRTLQVEKVTWTKTLRYCQIVQEYRQRRTRPISTVRREILTFAECRLPQYNSDAYFASNDFLEIDRRWKELRFVAIEKNRLRYGISTCVVCRTTVRDGMRTNVDHIKPRKEFPDLSLEESNLQVLCDACNSGKGNRADIGGWE